MNKLLIICYGYAGTNSNNANAICLDAIIHDLVKNRDISIITNNYGQQTYKKSTDKIEIHNIICDEKKGKPNLKKWKENVLNYLQNNLNMTEYNSLLTISFPFIVQDIGNSIKKKYPDIRWAVYELDPYAYNLVLRLPKIGFGIRYLREKRVIKNSDIILLTHEMYRQYSKNLFSKYNQKFKDIGIPMLKIESTNQVIEQNSNECNLIYTGSFYNKVRNPEYMLKVFSKVAEKYDFRLHIYGPDSSAINDKYKELLGTKIVMHGRVSKFKIRQALEQSKILINIGNSVNNQLPSKVLEYIGTGKPIINFYTIEEDTSNHYLKQYPNSFLIKDDEEDINTKVDELIQFIEENKDRIIPQSRLNLIFFDYSVEEVVRRIRMSI